MTAAVDGPSSAAIAIVGVTDAGAASLPPPLASLVAAADAAGFAASLGAHAAAGRRVVVVASGDPLLYGVASTLRLRLPGVELRVHPAPSSVALAGAAFAEPHHDAALASAHGRELGAAVRAALAAAKIAVLTDDRNTPRAVARAMVAAGAAERPAVVCERLGGALERIERTTLRALAASGPEHDPLNVLLLLPPARPAGPPHAMDARPPAAAVSGEAAVPRTGMPDAAFARRVPRAGLITKREVRVLAVAALDPRPGDVLWDVGAGSGSVAIEALRAEPLARAYAVERDAPSLANLAANARAFGVGDRLTIVDGTAPEACAALPDPDAVFVGGSGGALAAILATACARLRPAGRLVAAFATLEHAAAALAALDAAGRTREIAQIAIARGRPIAGATRFEALNPVWLVSSPARSDA